MAHKRLREDEFSSSPGRENAKRRQMSFPQTPRASIFSISTPKTPYTPYPLQASDSPSNPFGRRHAETLIHSLPPVTSFGKHLAFRFQFVRRGVSPKHGGVYRIAQVPLNYTFVHLRCLISFLFGVRLREAAGMISTMRSDDHLFEVKKNLQMYTPHYKPGQVKVAQTWAKLSSTRDPCRWQAEEDDLDDEEDELEDDPEEEKLEENEGEEEDWEWKNEEEFTLAHTWPDGLDTERGIIYYHSRTVQIHITVNQASVQRRRGSSNTPFVFSARGRVYLSPPPLPHPLFNSPPKRVVAAGIPPLSILTKPVLKLSDKTKPGSSAQPPEQDLTDTDADGDIDLEYETGGPFDESHPFNTASPPLVRLKLIEDEDEEEEEGEEEGDDDDDDDDQTEDITAELSPNKWNQPEHKFGTYLTRFMGPAAGSGKPITLFNDDDEAENADESLIQINTQSHCGSVMSTPDLIISGFSSPNPLPSSSPFPATSSPRHSYQDMIVRIASGSPFPLSDHYPNKKYKNTPAPPKAKIHRMRIQRVEKRIEKSKKTKYLSMRDESESAEEQDVDELVDDDEDEDEDDAKWVKPDLEEGEVWDPFGDEIEI